MSGFESLIPDIVTIVMNQAIVYDEEMFYQRFDGIIYKTCGCNKLMYAIANKASLAYIKEFVRNDPTQVFGVAHNGMTVAHTFVITYTTYSNVLPTGPYSITSDTNPTVEEVLIMLDVLIHAGMHIDLPDNNGVTPLMLCDPSQDSNWGSRSNAFNSYATSLMYALIACSANVNATDNTGHTLFHRLVQKEVYDYRIYASLLEAGYDANITNNDGDTILTLMGYWRDICHSPWPEQFHMDCTGLSKTAEALRCIVSRGADINHQNNNGDTFLHIHTRLYRARYQGCVISKAVKLGANPTIKNHKGKYPSVKWTWIDWIKEIFLPIRCD